MWDSKTALLVLLLIVAIIVTVTIVANNDILKPLYGGGRDILRGIGIVKSVCLMVGPYRNLTTLLAGVMALHPNVQVMNHGMVTLFKNKENNFIADYSVKTFSNFKIAAYKRSQVMVRGILGGSILASHAYDDKYPLIEMYRKRYGQSTTKKDPKCILWKESLRTLKAINKLSENEVVKLMNNPEIRLVMPIRNPFDVAISHLASFDEHIKLYGLDPDTVTRRDMMKAILNSLHQVFELQAKFGKDKVFIFFEGETGTPNMLTDIQSFMGLDNDPIWEKDAKSTLKLNKSKYHHDWSAIDYYVEHLKQFKKWPDVYDKMYQFIPKNNRASIAKLDRAELRKNSTAVERSS